MRKLACASLAAIFLSSCSGAANQTIPLTTTQQSAQLLPVSFLIAIPQGITPKYVSSATQSAAITVNASAPTVVNCTSSCSATILAPIGSDTFAATLYQGKDGIGSILSHGSTTATILQGIANTVSISFSGVPAHVTVGASATSVALGTPSSITITVTARDAAGNAIVGSYDAPITLSDADFSNATSLNVASIQSSSAAVSLSYNGSAGFTKAVVNATTGSGSSAHVTIGIPSTGACTRVPAVSRGFYPCDLQSAYNLTSGSASAGSGHTVAIVDAYDDPKAEDDLAIYRATFGLPPCTTANSCFKKVGQDGTSTYPATDVGWGDEISIDLDMASAICPKCNILLVEANSNSQTDLGLAENTAALLKPDAISNSYGGPEEAREAVQYDLFYNHPGIAITASSGDGGYADGTNYPAASPYVTAVGGTSLFSTTSTRGWIETVWFTDTNDAAGSGCSAYEKKPLYQTDPSCPFRMVSDVSAVADPFTGVAVYDSFGETGWLRFGGTSVSAPIIAAVFALAGNALTATVTYGSYPYAHPSGLYDVVSGYNGTCAISYFCTAQAGYDGPTGLGTPNGAGGITAFSYSPVLKTGVSDPTRVTYDPGRFVHSCGTVRPGYARCFALRRVGGDR